MTQDYKNGYSHFQVWLRRETAEQFRSKVKKEGKNITDVLRSAIDEYLKKSEQTGLFRDEGKQLIQMWLERETAEKLKSIVKNEEKAVTDILRSAIEEYLKK